MKIFTSTEAQALLQKVLSLSKADSAAASLSGNINRYIRYAQNRATTSGAPQSMELSVTANFGQQSGSSSTTDFTDSGLAAVMKRAEETAKFAPANPEFMPPLGPQTYPTSAHFSEQTQKITSSELAQRVQPLLQNVETHALQASGFLQTGSGFSAQANTAGLFVYDTSTSAQHTVTVRTPDGTGSGWAGVLLEDVAKIDVAAMGATALDKSLRSQKPQALPPGEYKVILEPAAVCDLVGMMMYSFDQRAADEGRSFATKEGGGSRLGETVFGSNITLYSNPADPIAPGGIVSDDGLPAPALKWVDAGVLKNLVCSRYWAQKNKRAVVPSPSSLVLVGGTTSTADMIKQTEHGLLITRFWYIREVDPQTVLLTGLTRDGVFLIEHGQITRPVQNFRFNESPIRMLNHVLALGPSVRTFGSELGDFPLSVPPLLVEKFNLTSVSDAV